MAAYGTPQPLTPSWLRAHFDPLPFPARMSALARYARTLSPDAYSALRTALDSSPEPDDRHLALFLAAVRRDLDAVAAALADPLLRRRALSAAIRLPVPEEALGQLALSESRSVRHETYRVLRAGRRTALADRLLPRAHAAYGPADAARLLPACSPGVAAEWLPRLDPPIGVLHTLARTAPAAVAARLAAEYEARDDYGRRRLARRHRLLAAVVAERDTDAGLRLFERAPTLIDGRGAVALLSKPQEVLATLRRAASRADGDGAGGAERTPTLRLPTGPLPRPVLRALRSLTPEELAELAEAAQAGACGIRLYGPDRLDITPDHLLTLLPAATRRRIVEARIPARGLGRRARYKALAALDPADRADLLRPVLARPHRSPTLRNQLAAVAPLADAEPILLEAAAGHRPYERAYAWRALLACAELNADPAEFARIVAACERAWHDREEVRRVALEQVAGAPRRMLAAVPLRVLRDAALTTVHSRDSTPATVAAAERWLRRTTESAAARGDAERAAQTARLLCQVLRAPRRRGPVAPLRLDARAAAAIWAGTAPDHLGEAIDRPSAQGGRPSGPVGRSSGPVGRSSGQAARPIGQAESRLPASRLVPLAELLAPHLAELPTLDALVGHTALDGEDPGTAARAAAAWIAAPATRERRCAQLIASDSSFATVEPVLRTLAARRTDLLEDVLRAARHGLPGQLSRRPADRWVPRLPHSVTGRWTARTRRLLDTHLAAVAADDEAPPRARAEAAALLRDPALLADLASSAPQPVAAAALTALGETAALGAYFDRPPNAHQNDRRGPADTLSGDTPDRAAADPVVAEAHVPGGDGVGVEVPGEVVGDARAVGAGGPEPVRPDASEPGMADRDTSAPGAPGRGAAGPGSHDSVTREASGREQARRAEFGPAETRVAGGDGSGVEPPGGDTVIPRPAGPGASGPQIADRDTPVAPHKSGRAAPDVVLSLLLQHAGTGGARGRAAMAGVRRLLGGVSDRRAVALLAPAVRSVSTPVGSRKEAVRALAELPGDAAFAALLAAWDEPGQHRDVRVVLVPPLLARVGAPGVADRLTEYLYEPAVRDAVIVSDPEAAGIRARSAYASFLADVVRTGDDEAARAACAALPHCLVAGATGTFEEGTGALAAAAVATNRPSNVWRAAVDALGRVPGEEGASALRGVLETLVARTRRDTDTGIDDRASGRGERADVLRRLAGCGSAVINRLAEGTAGELSPGDAVVDALLAAGLRREATGALVSVACAALRAGDPGLGRWERYLSLVREGPDRLRFDDYVAFDHDDEHVRAAVLTVIGVVRERGDAAGGLTALALVKGMGVRSGWPDLWRAEIDELCRHPDPDTAEAALLVDPHRRW
ncbi:hypothetical protein ACFV2X_05465 [Streptomyces sp. NPDC059679]|uniref:hypothetical protein n=1 Tax=Streptomyces sp. NPDC059679 TaxID=3346903 RepID=UPI0036B60F0E